MKKELGLARLIDGFKLSCQTEGKSPRTTEWYTEFLARFRGYLDSHHLPVDANKIGKDHIRRFILYLQTEASTPRGERLSPATVQGYVRTLKAFFSWSAREGYMTSNLMAGIPVPRAPLKIVNTFSPEQIAGLIDQCHRGDDEGCRNLAILLLMLDAGLRVSEVGGIDVGDVDLAQGLIKIRTAKGGKERIVPIGKLVQKSIWRYLNQSRPEPLGPKITRLFLSRRGTPLTENGFQQFLRRYARRAGITGVRCSPHTMRHTFAKNYLLNGGDVFSLQRILGHSTLASVRIYLNLFSVDIKKQHERFSPVDNMAGDKSLWPLARSGRHY